MNCAFCAGRLHLILDFGMEALAGGFLKREQFAEEKRYPLSLHFCQDCYAVQLGKRVDPHTLFKNYFYFSSATRTGSDHFRGYAEEVLSRFKPKTVLEIGCNDGVMLQHLVGKVDKLIGVDPAENVTRGIGDPRINIVSDFFNEDSALRIRDVHGKADLIVANNVFAHVDDICGMTRAIADTLSDHGVFVLEVHDLVKMVYELQYDWIYHEHFYYYSMLALEKHFARHGMKIFDLEPVDLHGGSMRYFVCKDSRHISHRVGDRRGAERIRGMNSLETFQNFAVMVRDHGKRLKALLLKLANSGQVIGGYGASGRANALMQHCGLDLSVINGGMYDDAPAKAGFFTPGTHIHINEGSKLRQKGIPDCLVVFAWTYLQEVIDRQVGYFGNLVVPFPQIEMRRIHVRDGVRMVL